jgi:putative PIN family toxin of toxin-antitoxin system
MILTQDNEYAVVLDACVLVPMPLCDTLLRLAEDPALYRPLWSEEILQEVGKALETKLMHTNTQSTRRLSAMRLAFPEAVVGVPLDLIKALECIPDPKDRHVLAAAIRGGANAIITQNTKDFPKSCLDQYDLICQHPDEFLVHQFHLNAEQVLEKLDTQAAAIQKERPYIIERLKTTTPVFAALAAERNS